MKNQIINRKAVTEADAPFAVERLRDAEDEQLLRLESGFKQEIGEDAPTEAMQRKLQDAIRSGRITFFVARCGERAVGMCSVAPCFSTFSCAESGVFEDFYIEPAFRGKGLARRLAQAAQAWCRTSGISSLTVSCAPCDEGMYQALGFDTHLGTNFAYLG